MATLVQISDGLITKLIAVSGLAAGKAISYPGSVAEYKERGNTTNPPFALIRFAGADYSDRVTDNSIDYERSTWEIDVVTQDFKGQSYSVGDNYTLLDAILTAIQGVRLTYLVGETATNLPALEPMKLESVTPMEQDPENGFVTYRIICSTAQVRQ